KRSPILGYNHNVRYRGVVFHVQTEDSGLMNPHLFTHLFHEGVIVSTRKLVYDAGSNEEAIKALMQAQHKAVMKDLRRGAFDDKIDQYLSGTPGLEPRAGADPAAPIARGTRAATEESPPPDDMIAQAKAAASAATSMSEGSPIEIVNEGLSEPIELPLKNQDLSEPIELPMKGQKPAAAAAVTEQPAQSRTQTADRTSRVAVRQPPPPPPEDDAPTLMGSSAGDVASAISAANAGARIPSVRAGTPPPIPQRPRDSNPLIELNVDEDDIDARLRGPRDTAVSMAAQADGVPARSGADSVPPQTVPVRQQQRPASHGAAALPPMKPPTRPSVQPPMVTARATGNDDHSAPVEIHAPASADPPERPGQYSVSRRDAAAPMRENAGRVAQINPTSVPAGLSRPRTGGSGGVPTAPKPDSPPARAATPPPTAPAPSRVQTPPPVRAATQPAQPSGRVPQPQPNRVHVTAPITNRTPSPSPPTAGSGVVMTRPAVIVGAPQKPPSTQTQTRIRKAREDEGRGFGQGLISEKSLDEVILAYLSEDAEDK
ncbi:MAG TPA: hypothetical protein VLB44_05530, partial [Kofleriaceae bacterium]|nr:hypothetical protein [Kofleriaceae bacterium]